MKIIGIAGVMGSGKSVFSEAFPQVIRDLNRSNQIMYSSMSSDIKSEIAHITGIERDEIIPFVSGYHQASILVDYSAEAKATYLKLYRKTIGQLLQEYGKSMRDIFGDEFWVNRQIAKIISVNNETPIDFAILDGVRYLGDVQMIKRVGGVIVNIERNESIGQRDETRNSLHVSETELEDYQFDFTLRNNSVHDDGSHPPEEIRSIAVAGMVHQIKWNMKKWMEDSVK